MNIVVQDVNDGKTQGHTFRNKEGLQKQFTTIQVHFNCNSDNLSPRVMSLACISQYYYLSIFHVL
jgi:hypothetical protein